MNYVQKEFNEIFNAMLEDSLEKGLISHAEEFPTYIENQQDISNYYVMDKSVIALVLSKFYEALTAVYSSMNIDIATGTDLDNLGAIVGVPRPQATFAMADVTFTASGLVESDIILDEGVVISNGNIRYTTLEKIRIPTTTSECTLPCIANQAGTQSKVVENSLKLIETELPYSLECTNLNSSTGGTDAYSDEEYRELLKNWKLINLKGSLEAFQNYFTSFNGIDGYKIVPNWNGSGTVKVILDPGNSYQLKQAYDDLREKVCQIDTDLSLFAPVYKPINVYTIIDVNIDLINPFSDSEKELIKSKIETAIKIFIDGGYKTNGEYYPGLKLGEDFIPHKLAVFVDEEVPELKNIKFSYPTAPVTILDEELGKSEEIIVEMI